SRGMAFSAPRGALLMAIGDLAAGTSELWGWGGASWQGGAGGGLDAGSPLLLTRTGAAGEAPPAEETPRGGALAGLRWDGSAWARLATAGPPARFVGALAYDGARGQAVLFGGAGPENPSIGRFLGDTWVWDGLDWAEK